jgi:hypothetical protein
LQRAAKELLGEDFGSFVITDRRADARAAVVGDRGAR